MRKLRPGLTEKMKKLGKVRCRIRVFSKVWIYKFGSSNSYYSYIRLGFVALEKYKRSLKKEALKVKDKDEKVRDDSRK